MISNGADGELHGKIVVVKPTVFIGEAMATCLMTSDVQMRKTIILPCVFTA